MVESTSLWRGPRTPHPTGRVSPPKHATKPSDFPKGEAATRYNVIQKLTYLVVVLALLPLQILAGLAMSPGFDAVAPWLLEAFGGRQSARTIHFVIASLLLLFVLVHLIMVVLSGPFNNLRGMITGWFAIPSAEGGQRG